MTWRNLLSRIFRFIDPDPPLANHAAETRWVGPLPENSTSPPWPYLTSREMQVAWYIRHGLSNEQIAAELNIGVPTVKSHVHNLLQKFNFPSRYLLQEFLESVNYDPWA
jgi:DNA-binding NarL/FixJ family response regulator